LLQIGTSGPQGKDETTGINFWGQKSKSHDAEVRTVAYNTDLEATFSTDSIDEVFYRS